MTLEDFSLNKRKEKDLISFHDYFTLFFILSSLILYLVASSENNYPSMIESRPEKNKIKKKIKIKEDRVSFI
jgi:hypothetical protein